MRVTLVLIIYTLSHHWSTGQSLYLQYKTDKVTHQSVLDSIYKSKSYKNFKTLKTENDSLIKKLKLKGYLSLLKKPLRKINDSTYLQELLLGKQYRTITLIPITKDRYTDSLVEITLSRKRNKNHYPIHSLNSQIEYLSNQMSNQGYPFATVNPKEYVFNESDTVQLKLDVELNDRRRINNIVVKGYEKFPKQFLNHTFKKQSLVNDNNLEAIQNSLQQLAFVETTRPPELLFKKDSTSLYIYVKKKNINYADGLLGFNTKEDGRLELNGYIDLNLNNNLNAGEKLHIIYRGDQEDQTQLDINAEIPYIFKTNLGIQAGLNILRRDSTYQNSSFKAGVFYSLNNNLQIGSSYNNINSTANEESTTNTDYKTNSVAFNINYSKASQDLLFIKDEEISFQLNYGTRKTENNNTEQLTLKVDAFKNITLNLKNSIYIAGRAYWLDSDDILFNELFQVGGVNSIRGFNQNGIDTSFFGTINTEYRYRLNNSIYINSILDYGLFENYSTKKTENLYGIGIGTGILTKSGILQINIANGSFSNANLDFSSTVAHIILQIQF